MAAGVWRVRSSCSMRSSLLSTSSRRRRIRERLLVEVTDHQSNSDRKKAPATTSGEGLSPPPVRILSGRVAGGVISPKSWGRAPLSRSDPVCGLVHPRQRFVRRCQGRKDVQQGADGGGGDSEDVG